MRSPLNQTNNASNNNNNKSLFMLIYSKYDDYISFTNNLSIYLYIYIY